MSQSGSIVSKGTRLFRGATPMDSDTAIFRIKKTAGRGKTTLAICATAPGAGDQKQTILKKFEIPNGTSNVGHTYTFTVNGLKNKRPSIYFKGKSVGYSMNYTLYFERPGQGTIWEPDPDVFDDQVPRVSGFADVHTHYSGGSGFGGDWFHGGIEGDIAPDPIEHSRALEVSLVGLGLFELYPEHTGDPVPSWKVTSHQQMNEGPLREALEHGLGLMVAETVNSEWLCSILTLIGRNNPALVCNDMESVKFQIRAIKNFDEDHDWFRVVKTPWEALDARRRGQLAVVLGVEASNLFPSTDGDWKRQLNELYAMGVRKIYLAHESNNRFTGTAYHHTEHLSLPNQLTAFFSDEIDYADKPNVTRNALGLTSLGRELVKEMIKRHMIIDVDHISWEGVDDVARITKKRDYYPLMAGHTRVNGLLTEEHKEIIPELNAPPRIFEYVRESGGVMGIRTGPERVRQYDNSGVTENCGGSVRSFIQHYRFIADGGVTAAFASDFNAPTIQTLGPRFGDDACPDAAPGQGANERNAQVEPSSNGAPPSWNRYLTRGMSDVATEPALIFDMQKLGADTTNIERGTQEFINMWIRAYNPDRERVPAVPVLQFGPR